MYVLLAVELFEIFQEISTSTISPAAIPVRALERTVTAVVEFIDTFVATASAWTTSPPQEDGVAISNSLLVLLYTGTLPLSAPVSTFILFSMVSIAIFT
jgi:hypothetical protein